MKKALLAVAALAVAALFAPAQAASNGTLTLNLAGGNDEGGTTYTLTGSGTAAGTTTSGFLCSATGDGQLPPGAPAGTEDTNWTISCLSTQGDDTFDATLSGTIRRPNGSGHFSPVSLLQMGGFGGFNGESEDGVTCKGVLANDTGNFVGSCVIVNAQLPPTE